jgi:hypothetical protein
LVKPLLLEKQESQGLAKPALFERRWFIKLDFPVLCKRLISDIQPLETLLALRPIEKKVHIGPICSRVEAWGKAGAVHRLL